MHSLRLRNVLLSNRVINSFTRILNLLERLLKTCLDLSTALNSSFTIFCFFFLLSGFLYFCCASTVTVKGCSVLFCSILICSIRFCSTLEGMNVYDSTSPRALRLLAAQCLMSCHDCSCDHSLHAGDDRTTLASYIRRRGCLNVQTHQL